MRYHNELWSAVLKDGLGAGRQAHIIGMHGMQLVVQSLDDKGRKAEF